jgi:hypothetical protein
MTKYETDLVLRFLYRTLDRIARDEKLHEKEMRALANGVVEQTRQKHAALWERLVGQ